MKVSGFLRYMVVFMLALCVALVYGKTPMASAEVDMSKVDTSIQAIIGTWREGDSLDARVLRVNPDYTYELVYRGGGTSCGTVRVIGEEHPDGTYSPWYSFDEVDGKNWLCSQRMMWMVLFKRIFGPARMVPCILFVLTITSIPARPKV